VWEINDDGAVPLLPSEVFPQTQAGEAQSAGGAIPTPTGQHFLESGCWIMQLVPFFADDEDPRLAEYPGLQGWTIRYLGTMRIECPIPRKVDAQGHERRGVIVSGDLYADRQIWSEPRPATPPSLPEPVGIPIYSRDKYAFYVTLQEAVFEEGQLVLKIATYRFNNEKSTWGKRKLLTARFEVENIAAPWRQAAPRRYLCGWVYNESETRIGKLEMGWISPHYRSARIEIAVAAGLEAPLSNGRGDTLKKIFKQLGWKLKIGNPVDANGPSEVWQESDLHARMLELRSAADLDREWLYHVLVVPRFNDQEENGFGKMYDVGALDTDLVPREGLVVAAEAKFPQESRFGAAGGQMLKDVPAAAFHNLVHELGHAMGLLHRFRGADFMQALIHIASQALPGNPFPDNLAFRFDPLDELRLRHYPDIWVRPGGVPFGQGSSALPVPDVDAITDVSPQFNLLAKPLRRVVPLGAPVKLQLRLKNISKTTLPGPSLLSLSAGSVSGRVIGPEGKVRFFSAAAPIDFVSTADLDPDQALYHGETLWRGPEGALFPAPGYYEIELRAGWVGPGGIAGLMTRCDVLVAAPRNRRHELAALDLLGTEDLAILLVFRASSEITDEKTRKRLQKAIRVLQKSLEVKELRASLAPIEAVRLACIDLKEAAIRLEEKSLMTTSELDNLLTLADQAPKEVQRDPLIRRMATICRSQTRRFRRRELAPQSLLDLAEKVCKSIESSCAKT
jgi:hypothetical protein